MGKRFTLSKIHVGSCLLAVLAIFCAAPTPCSAQAPGIEWQKAIPANAHGEANAIYQTTDGGYIVAGTVDTPGIDAKVRLIKLDASGTETWRRDYGGPYPDEAQRVIQTADGGFLVSALVSLNGGDVTGHHGQYDIWLMKTDAAGTLQWQRCYGGSNQELWAHTEQTPDGGYILCSGTKSSDGDITGKQNGASIDGLVMKLSATGAIQWQRTYGGSGEDLFRTIVPAPGGYYVCGYSAWADGDIPTNAGGPDAWILKLDLSGNIVWQKVYGGGWADGASAVTTTPDGGCVAVGIALSANGDFAGSHGGHDAWAARLTATGGEVWKCVYGGIGYESFDCVRLTTDGGFVVMGRSEIADGDVATALGGYDIWLLRLSAAGIIDWQKALGGSEHEAVGVVGSGELIQTADGGYALASATTSPGIPGIPNPGQNLNNWYVVKLDGRCDTVVTVHDTAVCAAEVSGLILGDSGASAQPPFVWSTGDASATIAVSDTGTFWRISGSACHRRVDTFRIRHQVRSAQAFHDTTVCPDAPLLLGATDDFLSYRWNTGDTTAHITTARAGLFVRTATDNCRQRTDSFLVRHTALLPLLELGPPVQACRDHLPRLGREISGVRYRWSTGETTAVITPAQSGVFSLEISNGCESAADSVQLQLFDCAACFFLPTAFSPNGDGRNDGFGPVPRCNVRGYRMEIFSRWGQCVFKSARPDERWDGRFRGQPLEAGVYFYTISASGPDGRTLHLKGDVTLIR